MGEHDSTPDKELEIEKRIMVLARINKDKFGYFYDKFYRRIYSYIQIAVLDPSMHEDLLEDTFRLALERLQSFRWQGVTFGAWLYRIALSVVREHLRKAGINGRSGVNGYPELVPVGLGKMTDVIDSWGHLPMRRAIERLDDDSRDMAMLYFGPDLNAREIAAIMDVDESDVRQRLARAKKLIAGNYGSEG